MSVKPTSHKFVDFQFLKLNVKIEDTIALLGLKVIQIGEQLRGACPACKSGGDRALVAARASQFWWTWGQPPFA